MDRLCQTAATLLDRHPSPALPLEQLEELLAREHPGWPSARTGS